MRFAVTGGAIRVGHALQVAPRPATLPASGMEPIVYRLDSSDRLVYVNRAWCDFARANGGEALMPEKVIGRKFWDFIGGPSVRDVYQRLVETARAGRTLRFPYRCDSSDHRRQMEMIVEPLPDGAVQITSRLLEEQRRPPIPLFDSNFPREQAMLRVCSWCHSIADATERWIPLETAVSEMRLLERCALPRITHGICPDCAQRVFAITLNGSPSRI